MTPDRCPIIGVTGPDRGGGAAWWFTRTAVWLAGGHAVRITPRRPRQSLDGLDGLIIGGGADVDPKLYGQELLHVTEKKKPDEPVGVWIVGLIMFPLTWLIRKLSAVPVHQRPERRARRAGDEADRRRRPRRLPILGICRGDATHQRLFGGTLHAAARRAVRRRSGDPHDPATARGSSSKKTPASPARWAAAPNG
jgi:putative glutamine amidotransferase